MTLEALGLTKTDISVLHPIGRRNEDGYFPGYLSQPRTGRSVSIFSCSIFGLIHVQIELEFDIRGEGSLHGDGFALWLTKQRASPGPVFGSTDNFEGLGIFFDTYKNNRPGTSFPYVMAMMGDGQTSYDNAHDGKANELAGCSVCIQTES